METEKPEINESLRIHTLPDSSRFDGRNIPSKKNRIGSGEKSRIRNGQSQTDPIGKSPPPPGKTPFFWESVLGILS